MDLNKDDFEVFSPTADAYRGFYQAFAHFNVALFDGQLPDAMITMQRKKGARGFYGHERFEHRRDGKRFSEIALNPSTFSERTDREIISTLVHEMAHEWQSHFGNPGRGRYHNREWANKMIALGLMPTDTGEPDRKQTGDRVTHFIVEGGPFATEWQKLEASGYTLDYQDRGEARGRAAAKLKVRYACPACSIHVWGKPELHILCMECSQPMQ